MKFHAHRHRRLALTLAASVVASLAFSSCARAERLVVYERSGGIAGRFASMTVSTHGSVRAQPDRDAEVRRFKLTASELRGLKRALREARFSTLKPTYGLRPIADGFTQTVRYAGRRVTVRQGGDPPPRLQRLLLRLSRIAARRN